MIVGIRLKIANRQVSEIETFVVRNREGAANLDKMGMPNEVFLQAIPAGERATRYDLIKTATCAFRGSRRTTARRTIRSPTIAIGWRTARRPPTIPVSGRARYLQITTHPEGEAARRRSSASASNG